MGAPACPSACRAPGAPSCTRPRPVAPPLQHLLAGHEIVGIVTEVRRHRAQRSALEVCLSMRWQQRAAAAAPAGLLGARLPLLHNSPKPALLPTLRARAGGLIGGQVQSGRARRGRLHGGQLRQVRGASAGAAPDLHCGRVSAAACGHALPPALQQRALPDGTCCLFARTISMTGTPCPLRRPGAATASTGWSSTATPTDPSGRLAPGRELPGRAPFCTRGVRG